MPTLAPCQHDTCTVTSALTANMLRRVSTRTQVVEDYGALKKVSDAQTETMAQQAKEISALKLINTVRTHARQACCVVNALGLQKRRRHRARPPRQ